MESRDTLGEHIFFDSLKFLLLTSYGCICTVNKCFMMYLHNFINFSALGNIGHQVPQNKKLETFFQRAIQVSPLILPFMITILVWLSIDPFYVFEKASTYEEFEFIIIPARILTLIWVTEAIAASIWCLTTAALIILASSTQILARCGKILEKTPNSKRKTRIIKIYKELQIWNRYINQNFAYYAIPPIVFFGSCTLICTNYFTMKFPGRIPWIAYWIAPWTSIFGFSMMMMVLPEATMLWDRSVRFLGILKGRCYSKYEVRLCHSLAKVAMEVGPFGQFTKSWKMAIVWNIANYTMNVLLAF